MRRASRAASEGQARLREARSAEKDSVARPALGYPKGRLWRVPDTPVARQALRNLLGVDLPTPRRAGFRQTPLNNATLRSRIRYYHRLPDFATFLEARGGISPRCSPS